LFVQKKVPKNIVLSVSINWQIAAGRLKFPGNLLACIADTYNVNLYWLHAEKKSSSFRSDTAEIEVIEQGVTTGYKQDMQNYFERWLFQIPPSFIALSHPDNLSKGIC
jgi:hypothetical protein